MFKVGFSAVMFLSSTLSSHADSTDCATVRSFVLELAKRNLSAEEMRKTILEDLMTPSNEYNPDFIREHLRMSKMIQRSLDRDSSIDASILSNGISALNRLCPTQ